MSTIKLTSKRQVTFPAEVCAELGVTSGDSLEIVRLRHENQTVWVLKPAKKTTSPWIGSLRKYASQGKRRPWTREEHGEATARAMARDAAQ